MTERKKWKVKGKKNSERKKEWHKEKSMKDNIYIYIKGEMDSFKITGSLSGSHQNNRIRPIYWNADPKKSNRDPDPARLADSKPDKNTRTRFKYPGFGSFLPVGLGCVFIRSLHGSVADPDPVLTSIFKIPLKSNLLLLAKSKYSKG